MINQRHLVVGARGGFTKDELVIMSWEYVQMRGIKYVREEGEEEIQRKHD